MNLPGGEVFLGIRRGGVLPGSPNPGSISGPKSCFFFHTQPPVSTRFQTAIFRSPFRFSPKTLSSVRMSPNFLGRRRMYRNPGTLRKGSLGFKSVV